MSYREDWKEVRLGNLITHKKGFAFKSRDYSDTGRNIIKVTNLTTDSIDISNCVKINKKKALLYQDYELKEGDIIITTVGSWQNNPASIVGKVIKTPKKATNGLLNQNAVRLRSNNTTSQEFIFFRLKHIDFQNYLISGAQGSANQASITLSLIFDFKFNIPSLISQNRIASILSAFDEKIEANRQMNATLEAMAQAMFREYFIKTSFETTININEYLNFNPRLSIQKGTEVDFLEMKAVPTEGMNVDYTYLKEFKSGTKFQNNDTLLARITPCLQNGKTAFVNFLDKTEIGFGSTEFIVMRAKTNISPQFVYCLARNEDFRQHAINSMVGSSGRQRVQLDMLKNFKVPKIDMEVMKQFDIDTLPFFEKIKLNGKEINTLSKTRDLLLPQLMSGEIPA